MRFMLIGCMARASEPDHSLGREVQDGFSAAGGGPTRGIAKSVDALIRRNQQSSGGVDLCYVHLDAERFADHVIDPFAEHELDIIAHALRHILEILTIARR
jgi:hypothetical protein